MAQTGDQDDDDDDDDDDYEHRHQEDDEEEEELGLLARIDDALKRARGDFRSLSLERPRPDQTEMLLLVLEANQVILRAMSETLLGECRAEEPYKPLRPIIDENGIFRWCCTHTPPHCS